MLDSVDVKTFRSTSTEEPSFIQSYQGELGSGYFFLSSANQCIFLDNDQTKFAHLFEDSLREKTLTDLKGCETRIWSPNHDEIKDKKARDAQVKKDRYHLQSCPVSSSSIAGTSLLRLSDLKFLKVDVNPSSIEVESFHNDILILKGLKRKIQLSSLQLIKETVPQLPEATSAILDEKKIEVKDPSSQLASSQNKNENKITHDDDDDDIVLPTRRGASALSQAPIATVKRLIRTRSSSLPLSKKSKEESEDDEEGSESESSKSSKSTASKEDDLNRFFKKKELYST